MKNKELKKKIFLALLPLFALSLVVGLATVPKAFSNESSEEGYLPSLQSDYTAEDQKSDSPEPVYISIFKFIVNCNPFQKETQQ